MNNGTPIIAATGPQGQLLFYYQTGPGTWSPAQTVADDNTTSSAPAITPDSPAGTVTISAVSPASQLDFYWAINGNPTWNPETLPGSGIE